MRLQRFVMAVGAARVLSGRSFRRGARFPFPWMSAGTVREGDGFLDQRLYVLWPFHLLFRVVPAWNQYVVAPLIRGGVLELHEGDYFRNARFRPVWRWFRESGLMV